MSIFVSYMNRGVQLLVKLLYGLLYSLVIVLTLASIAIFVPLLIQIIHIG